MTGLAWRGSRNDRTGRVSGDDFGLLAAAVAYLPPSRGWPAAFTPVNVRAQLPCPDRADLAAGQITLLGLTRNLGSPPDWRQAAAPRLWRSQLHQWDWARGLAADPDRPGGQRTFARLWRSWQLACASGRGDAWQPGPTAVRAWSWCGLYRELVAGSELDQSFVAGLAAHTRFLRRQLRADAGGSQLDKPAGGSHLIRGLKALIGLAVFFGDDELLRGALDRLIVQLAVQVRADGGHFERAPAYHCQVLADLIDITGLIRAAGAWPATEITSAIACMRRWLGIVLGPDGTVPVLGAGYPVPASVLGVLAPEPRPDQPMLLLPDTGLVSAVAGGWQLLADIGDPLLAELPAHAHADALGCLLHVDGAPLLSAVAHNTVQVDGASAMARGTFRAGRPAQVHMMPSSSGSAHVTFGAVHAASRRLAGTPAHRRRWSLTSSGLRVDDWVTGAGRPAVVARWQLPPGATVRLAPGSAMVTTAGRTFLMEVSASAPVALSVEPGRVAVSLLSNAAAPVLACRLDAALPVMISTRWRRAPVTQLHRHATA